MRNRLMVLGATVCCSFAGDASATVQGGALSLLTSVPTSLGLKMSAVVALVVLAADRLLAGRSDR